MAVSGKTARKGAGRASAASVGSRGFALLHERFQCCPCDRCTGLESPPHGEGLRGAEEDRCGWQAGGVGG